MSIAVDSTNMDTQISITVARSQARKNDNILTDFLTSEKPCLLFSISL